MYIYWEEISQGHMRRIRDNEEWSLYCDYDKLSYDCLNLRIGDEVHCVCDSDYWTSGRPALESYYVGEYFTAVVKAVFELVTKNTPEYIDLSKIQEDVIEPFWKEWQEKGYVENE